MKIVQREEGLTMVEVLITSFILVILMGGVYQAATLGFDFWERDQEKIDVQQNVRIAISHIARELRMASSVDISPGADSDSIEITLPGGKKIEYELKGSQLQRSVSGEGNNIVAYDIENINFSDKNDGKIVTIEIEGKMIEGSIGRDIRKEDEEYSGFTLKTDIALRVLQEN